MAKTNHLRIGIALGSGVARGWAHIGVLKGLAKAGIECDIISGTSIGALVGGCYLAGKMEPLEEFAISLTRRRLFKLIDFRFRASGIFGDSKLEALMYDSLGNLNIEQLDRTFVCVTTELATGHEVWLREGSIVQAIRASYALPGIFAPVSIDNRWLIDGALVNPVPVSVTRALGARLVIAVNLNTDPFDAATRRHGQSTHPYYIPPSSLFTGVLPDEMALADMAEIEADGESTIIGGIRSSIRRLRGIKEEVASGDAAIIPPQAPGFASVLLASLNIVQDRLARARLAGDPPDIVIAPRIGHLTLLEFDRAEELIRLGEEAAEEAVPQIEETLKLLR